MNVSVHGIADIENGNPNATRKGIRAVIDKAVLDEDNNIIGFIIRYSSWHNSGSGYFMLPHHDKPQTDCPWK